MYPRATVSVQTALHRDQPTAFYSAEGRTAGPLVLEARCEGRVANAMRNQGSSSPIMGLAGSRVRHTRPSGFRATHSKIESPVRVLFSCSIGSALRGGAVIWGRANRVGERGACIGALGLPARREGSSHSSPCPEDRVPLNKCQKLPGCLEHDNNNAGFLVQGHWLQGRFRSLSIFTISRDLPVLPESKRSGKRSRLRIRTIPNAGM